MHLQVWQLGHKYTHQVSLPPGVVHHKAGTSRCAISFIVLIKFIRFLSHSFNSILFQSIKWELISQLKWHKFCLIICDVCVCRSLHGRTIILLTRLSNQWSSGLFIIWLTSKKDWGLVPTKSFLIYNTWHIIQWNVIGLPKAATAATICLPWIHFDKPIFNHQ